MGLFDTFKKKKEEVKQQTNTIKVLLIRDYNDYKEGQIVEIDKPMADYLTRGGYASTNLNANVEEERKRVDDELYRKQIQRADKIINDGYNENEKYIQESYRVMSDISSRLGGTFPKNADPGVEMARRIVNEMPKERKTEPPKHIPVGAAMAKRLLQEVEAEQKQNELNSMLAETKPDSIQKEDSNTK